MIAVFVDGPVAGEVMEIPEALLVYAMRVPDRVTECVCPPGAGLEPCDDPSVASWQPAEVFQYNLIARGPRVAIYSEEVDDENLVHNLKGLVRSDFRPGAVWRRGCRDRRAYR